MTPASNGGTRLPFPHYKDDAVTLYHGDCRELLPILRAEAVVTDPPYGLDFEYASHDDNREAWFALMDIVVPLMRAAAPFVAMPCCGIDRMAWWYANHHPTWIVAWYKGSPGHRSFIGFNDWEAHLVWGKPWKAMHDYFQSACGFDDDRHPCPKPVEWATWWVSRAAPQGSRILDPFAGSGTTLWAAKMLGRKAIGIEIDAGYCDLIAERCAQDVIPIADPHDVDEALAFDFEAVA